MLLLDDFNLKCNLEIQTTFIRGWGGGGGGEGGGVGDEVHDQTVKMSKVILL